MIVFDFDKTLTHKDTVLRFYKMATQKDYVFKLKLPFYYLLAILSKLRIISNDYLKNYAVKLFLYGKSRSYIDKVGKEYAKTIILNNIYNSDFLSYPKEKCLIVSASYEEYLNPLFPKNKVYGSKLKYDKNNRVVGVSRNLYGKNKKVFLNKKNIKSIDILFTDSYSDKPLMEMAEKTYLINKGTKNLLSIERGSQ